MCETSLKTHNPVHAIILSLVVSLVLLVPASHAQAPANVRVARLSRAEGQVAISHSGSNAQEQAVANMPIQEGDTLSTTDGMAEVEFDDGAVAYLNQNAQLEFTHLAQSSAGLETELTLQLGTATFSGSFTSADSFRVDTLTFQVAVPATAEFRIDTLGTDGAAVEVLSGSISVSTKSGSITLDQGQSVAIHLHDLEQPQAAGMAGPDDFDAWVSSLSGVQIAGRNEELRFWSPPVYYGYSDLSVFGNWINFPGLGMCWRPYGSGANWQPFVNGAWRLNPRLGWTWVSFEPWGWLPYHYGAWQFAPGGWIWVPGPPNGFRWYPARVHWIREGPRVGWVAIGPHDAEGLPENLAHGFIARADAAQRNAPVRSEAHAPSQVQAANQVQIMDAKQLRNVERLPSPPSALIASALPPASRLEKRTLAEGSLGMSSIIFDPQTRTYINGSGLPLIHTPESRADATVNPQPARNATFRSAPSLANPNVPLSIELGLTSRSPMPRVPATPPTIPGAQRGFNNPGFRAPAAQPHPPAPAAQPQPHAPPAHSSSAPHAPSAGAAANSEHR